VVVAEGAQPLGGKVVTQGTYRDAERRPRLGGISNQVAGEIEHLSGLETRVVILGHLQRGGTPTPFDRWLATRFGVRAVELAVKGLWGRLVALRGTEITHVPISEAVQTLAASTRTVKISRRPWPSAVPSANNAKRVPTSCLGPLKT